MLNYQKHISANILANPDQQNWSQTQTFLLQSHIFSFIISAAGCVTFDIALQNTA